ncbi:MAG: hypothetical protein HN712_23780 [Gemmatimonadetes bacterium]|jgi:hypothetical protein|nr:hypothetical protein [Gemmatimonadota bacterium]MBT6150039.1 hypothetical protein [Gemmatimonadota bacterium]MBT7863358.1 hypothetical protein [Gemmatimonadota bacterium]
MMLSGSLRHLSFTVVCLVWLVDLSGAEDFRVLPYLQNPAPEAMTILWLSDDETPGTAQITTAGAEIQQNAIVFLAEGLAYPSWEADTYFGGAPPSPPFRHRVRFEGLSPATSYQYRVRQGVSEFEGGFTTAPARSSSDPVRLIFFADSETEPESTGKHTDWPDPTVSGKRPYLLDQTQGLLNNLQVIADRNPQLLGIAGDLVESGGEQRDWDEFWRHMTHVGDANLAARIPLVVAPGNHEYYEGPRMGRYEQPGSERAIGRWLSYFENPENGDPHAEGRYYRLDYGPVTLICLDVTNGIPQGSEEDTNYFLLGDGETGGGNSPSFGEGSRQRSWLREQLADSRRHSAFTFVFFHHVPYSVGPHGWPAGDGTGQDAQSGVPVRSLTPLFHEFGVDALIAGHDEMWERSRLGGTQILDDGTRRDHTLHVYDVGIAGDGLRGPQQGLTNPYQQFLAHHDAPEVWSDGVLEAGGKHYGHLEIDILPADGGWEAVLKPVHVFPFVAEDGSLNGYERRLYDDIVVLRDVVTAIETDQVSSTPEVHHLQPPYPNPFNSTVLVRFQLAGEETVTIDVRDGRGAHVRKLVSRRIAAGWHTVEWNGRDDGGREAASGVYLISLKAGAVRDTVEAVLVR